MKTFRLFLLHPMPNPPERLCIVGWRNRARAHTVFTCPCGFHLTESVYQVGCKSQFPHKSVNLIFMLVITKNKLTDLWGSSLLQNDFINTF